jgi:hypothetical protein
MQSALQHQTQGLMNVSAQTGSLIKGRPVCCIALCSLSVQCSQSKVVHHASVMGNGRLNDVCLLGRGNNIMHGHPIFGSACCGAGESDKVRGLRAAIIIIRRRREREQ